jgi:hypothetical protein
MHMSHGHGRAAGVGFGVLVRLVAILHPRSDGCMLAALFLAGSYTKLRIAEYHHHNARQFPTQSPGLAWQLGMTAYIELMCIVCEPAMQKSC